MRTRNAVPALALLIAAALTLAAPQSASAHFLWLVVEPAEAPGDAVTARAFFNEPPVPDGDQFLDYVRGLTIQADGRDLPTAEAEDAIEAHWAGAPPAAFDVRRDYGLRERGGESFNLVYSARAQTRPVDPESKPPGSGLHARLIQTDGGPRLQVLYDGRPLPEARVKLVPESGDPSETMTDAEGRLDVEGLAKGRVARWANHVEPGGTDSDGQPAPETRHYASLTVTPMETPAVTDSTEAPGVATRFATMPDPAVNSFGGAVLDGWLYVYSGHRGETHNYSTATTSRHFRRLNLADRTTWEDLPMGPELQGVALVSDGRFLYRIGGMRAENPPESPQDLRSLADFARFDPESKTWTDLPPMPDARSTHDAVVIGRTVYVVGGWTMAGASERSEFLNDAIRFDLDQPELGWRSFPQPFARRALSAGEADGKLYVLGGLTDLGEVERRVDVYDPATDTWTLGPEIPAKTEADGFGTSAFAVNGQLYVSGASGLISRLSKSGDAWEPVGTWSLPRLTHRLLPGPDGTLLAVGGNSGGHKTPIIESITPPPPSKESAPATSRPAPGH